LLLNVPQGCIVLFIYFQLEHTTHSPKGDMASVDHM